MPWSPTYRTSPSQAEFESWYALRGWGFSKIWAQMMRQISLRGEDIGITCDWRSPYVTGGAVLQYPADDVLVGVSAHWEDVIQWYMQEFVDQLNLICESELHVDCHRWYYAPNESTLPYCTNLDEPFPMVFTGPTLSEDLRKWKEWMTKLREVVTALDRQRSNFPIPHPLDECTWTITPSYTYGPGSLLYETPSYDDSDALGKGVGYRLKPHLSEYPFPGFSGTGGFDYEGWDARCGVLCKLRQRTGPPLTIAPPDYLGAVYPTDADQLCWDCREKVTTTWTIELDAGDWETFKATYGVDDTAVFPFSLDVNWTGPGWFGGDPFRDFNGLSFETNEGVDEGNFTVEGQLSGGSGSVEVWIKAVAGEEVRLFYHDGGDPVENFWPFYWAPEDFDNYPDSYFPAWAGTDGLRPDDEWDGAPYDEDYSVDPCEMWFALEREEPGWATSLTACDITPA
jgi:hypothetical protein